MDFFISSESMPVLVMHEHAGGIFGSSQVHLSDDRVYSIPPGVAMLILVLATFPANVGVLPHKRQSLVYIDYPGMMLSLVVSVMLTFTLEQGRARLHVGQRASSGGLCRQRRRVPGICRLGVVHLGGERRQQQQLLLLQLVGLGLMSTLPTAAGEVCAEQYGCQVVLGLGFGLTLSSLVIVVRMEVDPEDVGVAFGVIT